MEIQFSFKVSSQDVLDRFFNSTHIKVIDNETFKYNAQIFKVCYWPFNKYGHNGCDVYFETLRTGNSKFVDNVVSIIIDKIKEIADSLSDYGDNGLIHVGLEYFESDTDIERLSKFSSKYLK